MQITRHPAARTTGALSLLVASSLLAARTGADTFAVGAACPHPTIASAVLAAYLTPGDDLIKITQNLTNQAVLLQDFDPTVRGTVTIRGGYTSCADTSASGLGIIDGTAASPVFLVETSSATLSTVILENLELSGAERGVEVTAGGQLTLHQVLIRDNHLGGALVVDGLLVGDASSTFLQNGWGGPFVPSLGGGIQCDGGALILSSWIDNNRAELGGGLGLTSGCTAELLPAFVATSNFAHVNGGGIYADNGSVVTATGDGGPSWILANLATAGRGGGIYVADSAFIGTDVGISRNQADLDGGGIYATADAVVSLTGVPGACAQPL